MALASVTDGVEMRSATTRAARMERVRHKINVRVWRVLRQLRDQLPDIIELLTKKPPVPARAAVLLGHVVGVSLRMKTPKGKAEGRSVIEAHKVSRSRIRTN